ncbi:hypothetical protein [Carboxylicivirga marina]|uniref:hypothetical protein n=1 Tax=Carboxylicivirga marina TaxID=2800988 RepID=UPI0025917484|nr:hypothetical protein [uncultured Carboxylicivirga sp.]
MQKILLLCGLWLCAAFMQAQQKYVIGSPISSQPINYHNSNGENMTLFPAGDNVFNYLLSAENLPCIKKGNVYYYCIYRNGGPVATPYEVGTNIPHSVINVSSM